MRSFLYLWVLPVSFLVVWYSLSYNDYSGGLWFFSRDMHDQVMSIYAAPLGLEVADMPAILLNALVVDTALVVAIMGVRHRKAWWPRVAAFIESRRQVREGATHREQTSI